MQIARFLMYDRVIWGSVDGEQVRALLGSRFANVRAGRRLGSLSDVRILAPVERTNKVIGIAANYGERDDRDGPGLFMKPQGTNIGHLEPIVYPRIGSRVVHEAEVGIVIGRAAKHVRLESAMDHVLGYTCANDVSALALKTSDIGRGTTMRWKHFDTFCPLGPTIATGLDGDVLGLRCRVNGETVVDSSSSNMIWNVAELVAWVSEVMTLNPGDIICSGCPTVGDIKVGDTVEVEVEGVGILRNPVVADDPGLG